MRGLAGIMAVLMVIALATPVVAGEGKRCSASTQDCLNYMNSYFADRGWIGIEYDEEKMKIIRVFDDSPAEKAGLKKGDVMVAINGVDYSDENGEKIKQINQSEMKPGNKITYTVARAGMKKNLEITIGALPDDVKAQWIGRHMIEGHAEETQLASKD
jgi:C-terminal processing protease CtpA/Prc